MSKTSRKFRVPDPLAELYDFANTLDLRCFQHRGVRMQPSDEIETAGRLGAWLAEHHLGRPGAAVRADQLQKALQLRASIRNVLEQDPVARHVERGALAAFDEAARRFPLVVQLAPGKPAVLAAAREDAVSGLSTVVAQFYDAAKNGMLDRLKMCASEECKRVFYDRSKPGTRRWCQSAMCGNRMKTRAWRARQKESA